MQSVKYIDVRTVSDLESLVDEVQRTAAPHVLTRDDLELAMIVPLRPPHPGVRDASEKRRTGIVGADDALLNIVGMLDEPDPEGATDVSINKQRYLADAAMPRGE